MQAVHFREGALVKQGDLLVTIDPAPYAAEVERAEAQVAAAQARVSLTQERARARRSACGTSAPSRSASSTSALNAQREAEANLRAAQAALQSARLNLGYTQVRAPVAGRVGRLEITVGNLVAAGPGAPVLTTLVSVNPIYASFDADEQVVDARAEATCPAAPARARSSSASRCRWARPAATARRTRAGCSWSTTRSTRRSGTVRVRAVFDNKDGSLMPGQFARLRMGQAKTEPALLINERAVGTDQNKSSCIVVGADNKAAYREVTLGAVGRRPARRDDAACRPASASSSTACSACGRARWWRRRRWRWTPSRRAAQTPTGRRRPR